MLLLSASWLNNLLKYAKNITTTYKRGDFFIIIGVFEQNNYIKSRLSACLEGAPGEWHIVDIKNDGRNAFDIAVVTKNIPDKIISPILICPAEMAENLAKQGSFEQIVTVGYSSGDTVTFSSMGENALSVCFTDDIKPIFGGTIGAGEVVLREYGEPMGDMIVSAVLRCIGMV